MLGGFMIKRIIFDIDGTLITGVDFSSYVANTLKKYGIEDIEKTKQFLLDVYKRQEQIFLLMYKYLLECFQILLLNL